MMGNIHALAVAHGLGELGNFIDNAAGNVNLPSGGGGSAPWWQYVLPNAFQFGNNFLQQWGNNVAARTVWATSTGRTTRPA